MEDPAPDLGVLVGGDDDGASLEVACVYEVVEDVRGIRPVGEVAELVDDEDVRLNVGGESLSQAALGGCA